MGEPVLHYVPVRFRIGDRVHVHHDGELGTVAAITVRQDAETMYAVSVPSVQHGNIVEEHKADDLQISPVYFEDDAEPVEGEVWVTRRGLVLLAGGLADPGEFGYAPAGVNQRKWRSFSGEDRSLMWYTSAEDFPLRKLVNVDGTPVGL